MYILLFKPIKRKLPLNPIRTIAILITMIFSRSKYYHMARYDNKIVREMKFKGYREITLEECLKDSNAKIHAYKVIKPIDEKILKAHNKKMKTAKYDAKGALYSEAEKWSLIAWIFKKEKDDKEIFCN